MKKTIKKFLKMYINKVKTLKKVKKYGDTKNGYIAYIENNKAYILDNRLKIKDVDLPNKSLSLFSYRNDIFISDSEKMVTMIYNSLNDKFVNLDVLISMPISIEKRSINNLIFPILYQNNEKLIAKFDVSTYNVLETYQLYIGINGVAKVIDENTFVSRDRERIGVFGFDNKVWWKKRIARLGRSKEAFIHSDFQIYKNDLYFAISGTPDNKTFCIDVKKGKVKHKYKELIMFSRIEEDKLYNLFAGNLHILDLHSQRMHKIDLTAEFKKYNISTDWQYEVKSGLIYFKQSMGEVARIGIIDPLLEKVVWTYEFPNECGQVGTIRVAGNRIYAHTQDQTLHIFEREE